jgi:hypothetical protein
MHLVGIEDRRKRGARTVRDLSFKKGFAVVTGIGAVIGALKWIWEALSGEALPAQAILY